MSHFLNFEHHQNKYLLEIISPIFGWCSLRTFTNPCYTTNQPFTCRFPSCTGEPSCILTLRPKVLTAKRAKDSEVGCNRHKQIQSICSNMIQIETHKYPKYQFDFEVLHYPMTYKKHLYPIQWLVTNTSVWIDDRSLDLRAIPSLEQTQMGNDRLKEMERLKGNSTWNNLPYLHHTWYILTHVHKYMAELW